MNINHITNTFSAFADKAVDSFGDLHTYLSNELKNENAASGILAFAVGVGAIAVAYLFSRLVCCCCKGSKAKAKETPATEVPSTSLQQRVVSEETKLDIETTKKIIARYEGNIRKLHEVKQNDLLQGKPDMAKLAQDEIDQYQEIVNEKKIYLARLESTETKSVETKTEEKKPVSTPAVKPVEKKPVNTPTVKPTVTEAKDSKGAIEAGEDDMLNEEVREDLFADMM